MVTLHYILIEGNNNSSMVNQEMLLVAETLSLEFLMSFLFVEIRNIGLNIV